MSSAAAQKDAATRRACELEPVLREIGIDRPLRVIADELTRRRIPTPRGGQWQAKTVARVRDRIVPSITWHIGDALDVLRGMPSDRVDCCVTSPPYFRIRDYNHPRQIGLERSPDDYVAKLVAVFSEVRRVLKPRGVLWLNIADSYCTRRAIRVDGKRSVVAGRAMRSWSAARDAGLTMTTAQFAPLGLKDKDLLMLPAQVAMALRADGWYLRAEIIWSKPVVVPQPERDRPLQSHETIYLLSGSPDYDYYPEALREDRAAGAGLRAGRSVWTIAPSTGNRLEHSAVMPQEIARRCILAGSVRGGVVIDPFAGTGTVGCVARALGRSSDMIDLVPPGSTTEPTLRRLF